MRPTPPLRFLLVLTSLFAAAAAQAQEFSLTVEPAAAFWVDKPQANRFTPGFYLGLRPAVELGPTVGLQLSYALLLTQAREGFSEAGSANFLMAGAHVRPLSMLQPEDEPLGGLVIDGNVGFVRTGEFDRFGFDAGIGYGFQLAPGTSLGPVLRYAHIVQPDNLPNVDTTDAQFVTAGLTLVLGTVKKTAEEVVVTEIVTGECPAEKECVQLFTREMAAEERANEVCPDFDRDGVCDVDDRCAREIGPPATMGCPIDPCGGKPLIVLVQFPFDSDSLPPPSENAMDPVLDAVAAAIARDPTCRVCAIGHASIDGPSQHNQDLSGFRASAVQNYLVARGVDKLRIPTTGMGERCSLVPASSLELNRRVDFVKLKDGESCPTVCTE